MRKTGLLIIAVCGALGGVLAAATAYAQSGPQMMTNDPGTPGAGRWEINLGITKEKTSTQTFINASPEATLLGISL